MTDKMQSLALAPVGNLDSYIRAANAWPMLSADEERALAEKLLRLHNKYAKTATFTLPGSPQLVAGVTVALEGWGAWDGKYLVTQAKHTVGGSGYSVQVKLRKVLEGY